MAVTEATETKVKLKVEGLDLSFGGVHALNDVNLEVYEGEILAIIGPNGAGKTCILNCVSGFYHPQRGHCYWEGYDLTRLPSHKIASLGIARTFQDMTLYTGLSTQDNLMAARHHLMKQNMVTGALYFGWAGATLHA